MYNFLIGLIFISFSIFSASSGAGNCGTAYQSTEGTTQETVKQQGGIVRIRKQALESLGKGLTPEEQLSILSRQELRINRSGPNQLR